jgi:hypothetical protein
MSDGRKDRRSLVETTNGRAALPATMVAEQNPFFIAWGGPLAYDFFGRKHIFKGGPLKTQISPLRCAPVEMTKGRTALPATVVAEQDPLFIALTSLAQGRTADTADLSTTLLRSSGRDDKGEAGASNNSSC